MKVLSVTWAIYNEKVNEFSNNHTGLGVVVKNICDYIGQQLESYLFIGKYKLPEMVLGNVHIVGTDKESDIMEDSLDLKQAHLQTMVRAFGKALERIQPDIVNVHDMGDLSRLSILLCKEKNIPCVYTSHLVIGKDPNFHGYEKAMQWEKEILAIPDLQIIAVSTGMKKKILKNFPHISERNITVITNGTDFVPEQRNSDLVERYGLRNKKVLLCVGTILERKNQMQILRAFRLLPDSIKDGLKIIFCGRDSLNGQLQASVAQCGLEDSLIYAGAVSSEEMKLYYSVADGLIMASFAEGLSIAALEAIAYGLPVIMFSDSECAPDLDDENVVCFARDRNDEALAGAIEEWWQKEWDKDYILKYAERFTMERMADDYIKYYQGRLSDGNLCRNPVI